MTKIEKDEVWTRDEIESPCKKICVIHPLSKLCIGCFRTAEEIRLWTSYSSVTRKSLLIELPNRSEIAIPKKRRGRAKKLRGGPTENKNSI